MTIAPDIIAAAQLSERRYKIPASVTLAQWAMESGWGLHTPHGSNNPFGIKARAGEPRVDAMTTEVIGGRSVRMSQPFRKFDSVADAFEAHARLLALGKPYARARAALPDPDAFARALTGVYATAPRYGEGLVAVMRKFNLYQYDNPSAAAPAPSPTLSPKNITGSPKTSVAGAGALLWATIVGVSPEKVQPLLDAILQVTGLNLNSATNPTQWIIAGVLLLLVNGAILPRVTRDDDALDAPCFPIPSKMETDMSISPQIGVIAELVENDGALIARVVQNCRGLIQIAEKLADDLKRAKTENATLQQRIDALSQAAEDGAHLVQHAPVNMGSMVDELKSLAALDPANLLQQLLPQQPQQPPAQ